MASPADTLMRHSAILADALKKMFDFRKFPLPWQFLLNNEAKLDVEQLVAGNDFSMSGHMRTLSRVLTPDGVPLSERAALGAPGDFELTTSWYFVPHFCFDGVSVGAVVGENDDKSKILFADGVTRRYTRYARDDRTGDFFVLMVDADANIAEILYINPQNNRERLRAFVRFDYAPFMAAVRASSAGALDVGALAAAVVTSNIVQECRRCPSCRQFSGVCACPLALTLPTGANDRECNSRNMAANVGNFLGTAYHYIRDYGVVMELMTQCELFGGPLVAGAPRGGRLFDWAIYNRLNECPLTVSSPMSNSCEASADSIPGMYVRDEESAPLVDELAVTHAGVAPVSAYTLACVPLARAAGGHARAAVPVAPLAVGVAGALQMGVQGAMAAHALPVAPPGRAHASGVRKARRPGRGRRRQPPVVRPPRPVALRPAGAVPTPAPDADPSQYYSREEWERMQKTLRSRESAARSNEKRRQKTLLAKRAREQANQA